jgi:hypothetical protein
VSGRSREPAKPTVERLEARVGTAELATFADPAGRVHSVRMSATPIGVLVFALVDCSALAEAAKREAKESVEAAIAAGADPKEALGEARELVLRAQRAPSGTVALCLAVCPSGAGDDPEAIALEYCERAGAEAGEHLLCREVEAADIEEPGEEAIAHARRTHGAARSGSGRAGRTQARLG